MMAVSIEPGSAFASGTPRVLFEGQYGNSYDIAPDGRFLMIREERPADPTQLRFVLNWWDDVKQLVRKN